MPFDHPLWVLYSSGTTGLPKAIVQGQGGILLEHLKMMYLHLDAREGDRVFWFTTTGWMMWNFLVSVLLTDAAIVLYDGNPGTPDLNRLWDLAEESEMTCFGTSASYIASCMKAGIEPAAGRDLSALRAVGSTGSPLAPEGFAWVYEHVGARHVAVLHLGRHRRLHGVRRRLPGAAGATSASCRRARSAPTCTRSTRTASAVDRRGRRAGADRSRCRRCRCASGTTRTARGCARPTSTTTRASGATATGSAITERGTAVIYGRSDSTINRGGVRMGTSEIYRAVLAVPEVVDALVVDVPREGEENWMPLFVVLRDGAELDDALVAAIRRRVREDCSPRHVPSEVRAIAEVPRTLSGKVLEVPVKRILMGEPAERAASRDSLANPAALDLLRRAGARALAQVRARGPARSASPGGRHRPRGHARAGRPRRDGEAGGRGGGAPLGWRLRSGAGPRVQQRRPAAGRAARAAGGCAARPAPAEQQPGRDARRRVAHERVVRGERGGERASVRRVVPGAGGRASSATVGRDQQDDGRRELRGAEQRPVERRRRAPRPRRSTASAATASHPQPAGHAREPPRAAAVRAATSGARRASEQRRPPRRSAPRGDEHDLRRAPREQAAAAGRCGPRRRASTRERAERRDAPAPPRARRSRRSPPTAASAQPSASASGELRAAPSASPPTPRARARAGRRARQPRRGARRRCSAPRRDRGERGHAAGSTPRSHARARRRTARVRAVDAADLAFAGLARQAELIRAGEVSSRELAELYLERIARLDPG